MRFALLLAAVLAALTTTQASAAVIASSVGGFEGGPALASDGRVVVGERRGNGALRMVAIDPRTRATTELASSFALPATSFPALSVTGSGGVVTAVIDTFRRANGPLSNDLPQPPKPLSTRALKLLPRGEPIVACASVLGERPRLEAAGADGFLATIGADCGASPSSVRVQTADGTHTIPAAAGAEIHSLRATGPTVAWIESRLTAPGQPLRWASVVVALAATGEVLMRVPLPGINLQLGLGADGTVALPDLPACTLSVASPTAPALRTIQLPPGMCSSAYAYRGQGPVAVASGRIVYPAGSGYGVIEPTGAVHALPEARGSANAASPVAFDGRTVYVVRVDCDADRLLAVNAGAADANPPPVSYQPCPVRHSGFRRLRVARDGRVAFALSCPAGCRGTLVLVQQRGKRERLIGRAAYTGGPGRVGMRPEIAAWARRIAGCPEGLAVVARVHPVGVNLKTASADRGMHVATYRLASSNRCRRGGPAFGARRPGPRP